MKNIKFIFNIILKALFIFLLLLILLLFIYFVSIKIAQKKGKLSAIPINMFVILTQSMEPTINPGDIVIDYTPKNKEYVVGDVITFLATDGYHAGSTVTHRIIEIVEQDGDIYYRTKGDANNTADFSLIKKDNVIGKTIFKIPKAGYVRQFLVTKVGWILVVVMPCLTIICYDLLQNIKKKVKRNSKGVINNEIKKDEPKKLNIFLNKFSFNGAVDNKKDSDDDEEDFWGID